MGEFQMNDDSFWAPCKIPSIMWGYYTLKALLGNVFEVNHYDELGSIGRARGTSST